MTETYVSYKLSVSVVYENGSVERIYIRIYGSVCSPVSLVGQIISNRLQVSGILMDVVCQMSGLLLEVRLSFVSKTSGLRLHVKAFLLPLS